MPTLQTMVKFIEPGKVRTHISVDRLLISEICLLCCLLCKCPTLSSIGSPTSNEYHNKNKTRFNSCVSVAGCERALLKMLKAMHQKKVVKRSKVKPFIKIINYKHRMPTRNDFEPEKL